MPETGPHHRPDFLRPRRILDRRDRGDAGPGNPTAPAGVAVPRRRGCGRRRARPSDRTARDPPPNPDPRSRRSGPTQPAGTGKQTGRSGTVGAASGRGIRGRQPRTAGRGPTQARRAGHRTGRRDRRAAPAVPVGGPLASRIRQHDARREECPPGRPRRNPEARAAGTGSAGRTVSGPPRPVHLPGPGRIPDSVPCARRHPAACACP